MEDRRKQIARASLDWFVGLFGVPNVLLSAAALIWEIPPWIIFVVPLGTGVVGTCIGAVDKYRSTGREMLKAQEEDAKIEMVVRELQEKHALAISPDFTMQLPDLLSSANIVQQRQVRRTRRNVGPSVGLSHLSSPTQPSPLSSSRATTVNINVDSNAAGGMEFGLRRGEGGGFSIYTKSSESPTSPGLFRRSMTGEPLQIAPDSVIDLDDPNDEKHPEHVDAPRQSYY